LSKFTEVINGRHEYARQWKERTGGKVIGYLCTYVPEEVIYAAGMLPVRIMPSHQPQDVTEPHIFSMFCPYSRGCLAEGLAGNYDYLDGIVHAHGCYHIRQTFDSWTRHIKPSFSHYYFMPTRVTEDSASSHLPRELAGMRSSLEKWSGKKITDADLKRAIEVYNTNRKLLLQIYETRQAESPPLSGAESMEAVLAGMLMDKIEHNSLLEELAKSLPERNRVVNDPVRLMLVGSEMDDADFLRLVDSLGGETVIDDNCVGTRYFWTLAPNHSDPLESISRRYLDRPPCPLYDMKGHLRLDHIKELVKKWRVQSLIITLMKFCDPHEYDVPELEKAFKEIGIPTLVLESDLVLPEGQFRTRVEAHLEMLKMGVD
jgi:benzoyl-CoA reductase subunit C